MMSLNTLKFLSKFKLFLKKKTPKDFKTLKNSLIYPFKIHYITATKFRAKIISIIENIFRFPC